MRMYRLVIILVVGLLLLGCNKEVRKNYYPDGSVHQVIEYKDSLKHGKFKSYYNTGELEIEGNYENDKQEGLFVWYYKNGRIETNINFINGKEHGNVNKYYKTGNLKYTGNYENGLPEGKFIFYYPNGNIEKEVTFKEGKEHGEYKSFYENGKIKLFATRKNDTNTLFYQEYNKEGNIIDEHYNISIDPLKDSIKVGERFKAKIIIPGPIENRDVKIVPFVFGGVDKKSGMFKNKKEIIYTSLPTKKAGEYLFNVNVFIDTFSYNNRLYVKVYEDNGR